MRVLPDVLELPWSMLAFAMNVLLRPPSARLKRRLTHNQRVWWKNACCIQTSAIRKNAPEMPIRRYRNSLALKTAASWRNKATALSAFQLELLVALYEQQSRYRSGDWSFDGTIWSRAAYRIASSHSALRPSPAAGRKNMSRTFETKLVQARQALKSRRLVKVKVIRPHDAPAAFSQGYKKHRAKNTDVFLTNTGLNAAEAYLRRQGMMAEPQLAQCDGSSVPLGPVAIDKSGCD